MAKMLMRELTAQEQLSLAGLSTHPGFAILVKLMDEACRQKSADILKLDPAAPNYPTQLERLALIARSVNEFCASVRASVLTHVEAAVLQQQKAENDFQMAEEAERVLATVAFLRKQDNQ